MAFQQSLRQPTQQAPRAPETTSTRILSQRDVEQSQEWVLFAPSLYSTTARTRTSHATGLSRASEVGSLRTPEQPTSSVLEDETEDGDTDSLDDGLHAFREPPPYQSASGQFVTPVLPAHDGLGTFRTSQVLEQIWQHEQHHPKRKHDGQHRRPSSETKQLHAFDELEAQANEEKRVRIEKWRLEQSQALIEEVERETRRKLNRGVSTTSTDVFSTTPTQDARELEDATEEESEPFWRRITRKFIRDVIGIDEPLLSVILGESLPGEVTPRPSSPVTLPSLVVEETRPGGWRDRLLQRIARELGVFVHQLSPHPGAFSTVMESSSVPDYAGMPIRAAPRQSATAHSAPNAFESDPLLHFAPTIQDPMHAEHWGLEEEEDSTSSMALNLRKEREYWERELDVKMVFRYLRDRFTSRESDTITPEAQDNSANRTAIIRQHHPLVARSHRASQAPVHHRRETRTVLKTSGSSCASESLKSGHKSTSSRNYWDLGGSIGSGSLLASGGLMGA